MAGSDNGTSLQENSQLSFGPNAAIWETHCEICLCRTSPIRGSLYLKLQYGEEEVFIAKDLTDEPQTGCGGFEVFR